MTTSQKKFLVYTSLLLLIATPSLKAQTPETTPPAPTDETAAPTAAPVTSKTRLTYEKGGFLQGGGMVGYELNAFEALGGGATLGVGYQINPQVGIYLRSDFFVMPKDSKNHLGLTFIPSVRLTFVDALYGFVGAGYAMTYAPNGSTLTGTADIISRTYHNATGEAGLGYTYFFRKNFGVWGEGGLNYTRLDKQNFVQTDLWRPLARIGASYQF